MIEYNMLIFSGFMLLGINEFSPEKLQLFKLISFDKQSSITKVDHHIR